MTLLFRGLYTKVTRPRNEGVNHSCFSCLKVALLGSGDGMPYRTVLSPLRVMMGL